MYDKICFLKYKCRIPRLYSTEDVPFKDKMIYLHFFLCNSDWYIAEYDGEDTFFGFICLNGCKEFAEWDITSFKELKELQVEQPIVVEGKREVMFLEVECDKYWMVRKAKEIKLIREYQGW